MYGRRHDFIDEWGMVLLLGDTVPAQTPYGQAVLEFVERLVEIPEGAGKGKLFEPYATLQIEILKSVTEE